MYTHTWIYMLPSVAQSFLVIFGERERPLFIHIRVAHSDANSTCYQ